MKAAALAGLFGAAILGCSKNEAPPPPAPMPVRATVATVNEVNSRVEVKRSEALVWEAARKDMSLFNRDTIKTAAGATSDILFDDHSHLWIDENSTVTIQDHQKIEHSSSTQLALPSGSLRGELDEQVEMTVRTPKGWLKVSGASGGKPAKFSARLGSGDGSAEFSVAGGRGSLITQGHEMELKPGEPVAVKASPATGKEADGVDSPPAVKVEDIVVAKKSAPTKKMAPEKKPAPVARVDGEFALLAPENKSKIEGASATIKGRASADFKVYLNGTEVRAAKDGKFSVDTPLRLGANLLVFQIVNTQTQQVSYRNLELVRTK